MLSEAEMVQLKKWNLRDRPDPEAVAEEVSAVSLRCSGCIRVPGNEAANIGSGRCQGMG